MAPSSKSQTINDMDDRISRQGHYHNYILYVPETREIVNMSEIGKAFLNPQTSRDYNYNV